MRKNTFKDRNLAGKSKEKPQSEKDKKIKFNRLRSQLNKLL